MSIEEIKNSPEKPIIELEPKIEELIKQRVLEFLEKGREGWDVPHTLCVVDYMKQLIAQEGGNGRILVPAAYFHDIGYNLSGFKGGGKYDEVLEIKEQHAILGAKEAENILKEIGGFSDEEINEIVHLIRMHDELDKLSTDNEIMILEADTLAMIDKEKVEGTFSKEDNQRLLEDEVIPLRLPLFRSKFAISESQELIKKFKARYDLED